MPLFKTIKTNRNSAIKVTAVSLGLAVAFVMFIMEVRDTTETPLPPKNNHLKNYN